MSLFLFLTVVQTIVAAALVAVVLMQRSEGGGLGVGGNPNGMMSARGAADFLTRATKWLAMAFVSLSIALAAVAVETGSVDEVSTTIDRTVTPQNDPLASTDESGQAVDGASNDAIPAQSVPADNDPLADSSAQ